MIDVPYIKELIEKGDASALSEYITSKKLTMTDNKIFASLDQVKYENEFWDKKQLVKKTNLNSAYGSLLNVGSRFHDHRLGQSTTLTGRIIARHMDACINECIMGEYAHDGAAIIYGDSVTGDTIIRTDSGPTTIESLFDTCPTHELNNGKEYGLYSDRRVIGFNSHDMEPVESEITYVMRHKTDKGLYKITTENGRSITVTEDHSIMVDRDGFLTEVPPTEIIYSDGIITLVDPESNELEWTTIKDVEYLRKSDGYVYDLSIRDQDPVFFGNEILSHNTDSAYFSAWPAVKDDVEAGNLQWDKDTIIQLYDTIAEQVNASFPLMMERECHCPQERGTVIRGGREIVASSGIFIKKKRYAIMFYDKDGVRFDKFDAATAKKKGAIFGVGKVKAMGLDLKRSDTPKIVQDFLSEILTDVLTGSTRFDIYAKVKSFKHIFAGLEPWEKGTPKRVNNLTTYVGKEMSKGKSNMPGHVRAAMNWNQLRAMHGDNYSLRIVDGMKVIVCKLKDTPMGIKSVAYPIDIMHIPQWFKDLPFDNSLMESTIVNKKVDNLLGIMKWDIGGHTQINSTFNTLFEFDT